MLPLIQCVPNFSAGRDQAAIEAIVAAVRQTPGVRLADWSADADHNRLVVTFVGPPEPVRAAALASASAAIEHIDLREHQGVHPRLGAIDVLPFVPLSGITLADCAALAVSVGTEIAARHALPVFFYEAASPQGRSLPFIRKSAFGALAPNLGPPTPHPTAGAIVVGARGPLIAFNVNLAAPDPAAARLNARELRTLLDLPGIRALGLRLPSRGLSQVSMNLTRPAETPLLAVFQYIERRAAALGTSAIESEVIGTLPGFSAFGLLSDALRCPALQPVQVLWETWGASAYQGNGPLP